MNITYKTDQTITVETFIDLLKRSGLAERRPVEDLECIQGMIEACDLLVTAWDESLLVGIARSVTDFHYACYLSDLAVDKEYQKEGIGKELQRATQRELGPHCKLILIAAPQAQDYYKHIGYTKSTRCWVLHAHERLK